VPTSVPGNGSEHKTPGAANFEIRAPCGTMLGMFPGRLRVGTLAITAVLGLGACARTVVTSPPRPVAIGSEETGLASWYGHPYHGRPTSSGEVYDMHDLTAAHRTLPFGTRLLVTNLDNSHTAEVRVNDRGPFIEGRILDLSYGAASLLGAVGPGVIPVRLHVVGLPGSPTSETAPAGPARGFSVQLGAFVDRDRADRLREAVRREGSAATVSEAEMGGETVYRVRVGPYPDRSSAQAAARRLASRGYLTLVVAEP